MGGQKLLSAGNKHVLDWWQYTGFVSPCSSHQEAVTGLAAQHGAKRFERPLLHRL